MSDTQIERRKDMLSLVNEMSLLKNKIDHLQTYLESEFGGRSMNGEPTEGNTNRNFRELSESQIDIQKRIKILEDWRTYVIGGLGTIGGGVTLIALLISWVKK